MRDLWGTGRLYAVYHYFVVVAIVGDGGVVNILVVAPLEGVRSCSSCGGGPQAGDNGFSIYDFLFQTNVDICKGGVVGKLWLGYGRKIEAFLLYTGR